MDGTKGSLGHPASPASRLSRPEPVTDSSNRNTPRRVSVRWDLSSRIRRNGKDARRMADNDLDDGLLEEHTDTPDDPDEVDLEDLADEDIDEDALEDEDPDEDAL